MPPLPSGPPGNELDWIRAEVARFFPVYETRVTPNSLVLLVHPDPATLERRFDELRRDLWPRFYIPQLRYHLGEYAVEVVRRSPRAAWSFGINLGLLVATCVTTVFAGSFFWLAYVGGSVLSAVDFVNGGLYFAAPLLAILGVHELAHYVVARYHHVEASLPYFLPVPPPYLLFGTFGAFISVREPFPNRKILFDIGAAGPLAGFLMSLPFTVGGMFLSVHAPVLSPTNCGPVILGVNYGNLLIGLPVIWQFLALFVPNAMSILNLHPLAIAGWVGLLVTAINLLPAGQLDGGHVFRGLLGDRSRYASWGAVIFLSLLGLFAYIGWFVFAILILVLGVRHPPPLNDVSPIGLRRYLLGVFVVVVLVTGFVLVPIGQPTNAFGLESPTKTPLNMSGHPIADRLTMGLVNKDAVPHAYVFSGNLTSVIVNGSSGPVALIPGTPAWNAFVRNSSWTVALPNGQVSTFPHVASWSTPGGNYTSVDAGATVSLVVTYTNTQAASVMIQLTAAQLCDNGGTSPPATQTVSMP